MKPIYLEFSGLNSFSETAKIDFQALLKNGVFGIFGDTGSGKSTILDSIHFALYGEIDRAPKAFNDCINYRSEGAFVTFDFEIVTDGVRHAYRVHRERKRKNGTTKAYLYEHTGEGKMVALAEGTRDVDGAIEEIIGLTFADFKMCIALPQGDFAALVKATTSERVKLVARLFNLDKYGEKLSKAVNEKYYQAEEEVNLLQARMSENEGGRVEIIQETEEKLAQEKACLKEWTLALQKAEEEEKIQLALQSAKRDYELLLQQKQAFETRLPMMQELREWLSRLPQAEIVVKSAAQLKDAKREHAQIKIRLQSSVTAYEKAVSVLAEEKARAEKEDYEQGILKLSLDLQTLQTAQADMEEAKRWQEQLNACRAEYRELQAKCAEEDFDGKRAELEKEIVLLGEDETLLDYLKHHYKGVLIADTYGEIRGDLRYIAQKYPQTEEDVQVLLKKYAANPVQSQESLDIAKVNLAFKQAEQKRKTLKMQLEALEKRKRAFEENESKKKALFERGAVLAKTCEDAQAKVAFVKDMGSLNEVSLRLESLKKAQAQARVAIEKAQENVSASFAEKQKQEGLLALTEKNLQISEKEILQALSQNGFSCVEEAETLVARIGDKSKASKENQEFFDAYGVCLHKLKTVDVSQFSSFSEQTVYQAQAVRKQAAESVNERHKNVGAWEKQLARLQNLREKYKEQEKLLLEKQARQKLSDELRQLVKSNKFLEFIASEYLQEICAMATTTLLSLTGGRYFLEYDKEFRVGDNLDGGNKRGVRTLSGGETFLVSLSLALSLSNTICMKSLRPIEFFFLDEGFGTLDEKLVDTVMDVLGKLSKKFAVGLISHVEELKHRIESKLVVTGATEKHGSIVRTEIM